ncbi:MAG: hypothetical protein ACK40G_10315 [Cytophagaceae bacterium]
MAIFKRTSKKERGKTLVNEYGSKRNIWKGLGIAALFGVIGFSGRYFPYKNIKDRLNNLKLEKESKTQPG